MTPDKRFLGTNCSAAFAKTAEGKQLQQYLAHPLGVGCVLRTSDEHLVMILYANTKQPQPPATQIGTLISKGVSLHHALPSPNTGARSMLEKHRD